MGIRECKSPLDHVQPINRPNENTSVYKANIVRIIETERKVRNICEINFSFMKPTERAGAESKLQKKGRGGPRKNPSNSDGIVNGSLSDSDFINRKRVILREAHETLQLGKWI
ncbi:hypothetical protein V6N13_030635 [Hibiscus sabdariffa]